MEIKCKFDELKDPSLLVEHPRNANTHSDRQIDLLAKLIEHTGFRHPIIVSKLSGFIVAGHGRLAAAKSMSLKEVPVVYQDFKNEAEEFQFLIADNKIAELASHDDIKMLEGIKELKIEDFELLGLDGFEIPIEEVLPVSGAEDDIPENVETRCKPGDLWTLGNHRLLCGDSTLIDDVDKLVEKNICKLCFTSPPYSDQREYNCNEKLDPNYLKYFLNAPCELFAVNLGIKRTDNEVLEYWDIYKNYARELGMKLLSWNVWDRTGEGGSIGNMTAPFPITHEWIFVFGKEIKTNRFIENKSKGRSSKTTIRQKSGEFIKSNWTSHDYGKLPTVVFTEIEKGKSDIKHPAKMPVTLAENYIESCSDKNSLIYDPFAGSGTTLIACEKTNRKCFMMEIDPHYCDIILKRWEDYTGKKAQLEKL